MCSTLAECLAVLGRRVGPLVPERADLEHHDAHCVGDDVVELPCDPHTFLGHGDTRRRVAIALRLGSAPFRRLGLLRALAEREARDPADGELEWDEDELRGGVSGDPVDDDHRTGDDEGQAEGCLHGVAEVPEQERRYEPDHEDADRVRDQPPVDEGDRRRQRPVRCRRKRKAPTGEDRQYQDRDRRKDEPQRRARRSR